MPPLHDRLAVLAKRLIEKNGRDVTFRKLSRTLANPSKPWRGTDDTLDESFVAKGVFTEFSTDDSEGELFLAGDGELTRKADKMLLVAVDSTTGQDLTQYDQVEDGAGVVYKIVARDAIEPGPRKILWKLAVKQ